MIRAADDFDAIRARMLEIEAENWPVIEPIPFKEIGDGLRDFIEEMHRQIAEAFGCRR